jgi:hypothetical protein
MNTDKMKLLYIAGAGRSGTTVLARLLGEVNQFYNVGEAGRYLFSSKLRAKNIPCGCGKAMADCPFWGDIVPTIAPEMPEVGDRLLRLRSFTAWTKKADRHQLSGEESKVLAEFAQVYRRIVNKSGCEMVVDSSKHPSTGLIFTLSPEFETHVVHIVRNPRSVVASWTKKKGYLPAHPATRVLGWWYGYNLLSDKLEARATTYQRILYEDFVRDPGAVMHAIVAKAAGRELPLPFLKGNRAKLNLQHDLAGNPDKLSSDEVVIGKEKSSKPMPFTQRLLVDVTTFPMKFRYHYRPE